MNDPTHDDESLLDYLPLSGPERYAAFVAAVSRAGRLWIAQSGEYVLTLFDEERNELLPVWPDADTARAALAQAAHLSGYAPAERALAGWRERAAPALSADGIGVGVFPNAAMQCAVVTPTQLLAHIDAVVADETATPGEAAAEGLDLQQAQRELARKFGKPSQS